MTTSEEYYSKAAECFRGIAVPKKDECEEFDLFAIDPTEEQNLYAVQIPYYFRFRSAGKGFKTGGVIVGSKHFDINFYEDLGLKSYSVFTSVVSAREGLEELKDLSKPTREREFTDKINNTSQYLYSSLNALGIIIYRICNPEEYSHSPNLGEVINSLKGKSDNLLNILKSCSKFSILTYCRVPFTHDPSCQLIYPRAIANYEDIQIKTTRGTIYPIRHLQEEIPQFESKYNEAYKKLIPLLSEFLKYHDLKIDEKIAKEECLHIISRKIPPTISITSLGSGSQGPS